MNRYQTILFDLDGTLLDSGEGVLTCARLALETLGKPLPSPQEMRSFIGPPLLDSFLRFGCSQEEARQAIEIYRGRYTTVGKFEAFVYPGMQQLLQQLQAEGCRLYVATSKPENTSVEILEHFGLAPYFRRIAGASADDRRSTKSQVLAYLLEEAAPLDRPLMVGDTVYDVVGSRAHDIGCVGVSWGYGIVPEMRDAGALAIVDTMDQLHAFIRGEEA